MTEAKTPRIAPLARAEWTEAARDVFAFWEGDEAREKGSRSNTMMTLANHPPLALASLDLGKYFILNSTLSPRQQKLIVLRVAHRYNSTYQWGHNSLTARQAGLTEAEIAAVRTGGSSPIWNREDRMLLTAVDQTCDGGKIDDAAWAELTAVMSCQQIMDLIHAAGYFTMVAWGLVAIGVQLEDGLSLSGRASKPE
ncbi:carboxymuconolactone decarboxylase family protein [Novosphingobium album (ex Hu et al. 2023)]|uniref:Carboxymuconolactone decarboxylase family protein n=1 Tax=Novosphingobium album (ex Hu et al. 2023) TaxID=2930093 RepID=A0ABT0B7L6_9SPHN|nr:carboxymuconolactone decarboxylase family protein [Novosphingobium album (ex Hu et al. 2023)]MCJ2180843.1 carboxymuconolactone decarboxylase family protein [Novosphingobium album (ex Hu et al. 2023)]